MASKINIRIHQYVGKGEVTPMESENYDDKKQLKSKENEIISITYKLDKNLFESKKYLRLFGEDFIKKNEKNVIF